MAGKNYGPIVSGYLDPNGRNWEDVIFQKGKAVLDVELNLQQDVDIGQSETDLRRDLPSGWLASEFVNDSPNTLPLFVSSPGADNLVLENVLTAHVNGNLYTVQNTGTINTNTLNLGAGPTGAGGQRTDLIILEVWRLLLSPAIGGDVPGPAFGKSATGRIWGNGNVKNDPSNDVTLNYVDDILNAVIGVETTKRVQLQYRLRVIQGINLFTNPYGLPYSGEPAVVANSVPPAAGTPDGSPTAYDYVNQSANGDAGLWIAGDGNPTNSLGTVDGYMYAIPLCAVFRRNTTAFNPYTNLNGSAIAFGGTSDRPDGLFNDSFVPNDIADLRLAVSPVGWDYQEVLDKNLTYLLDNSLRSEWTSWPSSGGTQGHSPLITNQLGAAAPATSPTPIAQFDNVRRSFSGAPTYEVLTVACPAPGGAWANGAVVTINPGSLVVSPYTSVFNLSAVVPTNAQFVSVTRAYWIGASGKKTYEALSRNLAGTFNVTSNSPTVPTTFNQTGIVQAGDVLYFSSLPGTPYTVLSVASGSITLTTNYLGATDTTATAYDTKRSPRIASVTGLGLQISPTNPITITMGTIVGAFAMSALTNETLYVDVLVAYPPGSGLSATPVADFSATQQTFMVGNPSTLPATSPIYFDQTLLTAIPSTSFAYYNPTTGATPLASLDWTHREANLTYTTGSNIPSLTIEANSEIVGATTFLLPERASAVSSVQINGAGANVFASLSASGRVVTISSGTSPGDTLLIHYTAIRPFPDNGEQVTVFFDTRAPQTARAAILGSSQQVIPKLIPKQLFTLTGGVASPDAGYPFPTAYVQTGGVNAPDFVSVGSGEYELGGEAYVAVANFNASTGLLSLPIFVNYTPNPEQVTFTTPGADFENRTFFAQVGGSFYVPNAYAQDLSDPKPHKNFMGLIAELAVDSQLGFAGQLVLVLLTRWAENDQTNGVFFDTSSGYANNTTSAAIFRLRNSMLNKRA
jgi:hypothetical protein